MLRFVTAGESHGEALVATISGMPAGIPADLARVNRDLWRRQQGFGRGGRMKIESDEVHILSGVRHGKTIGSPIAVLLRNKDWKNWTETLPVQDYEGSDKSARPVHRPRPGHADLAGCIKYNYPEARYILERASARETAARVAVGGFAKLLLSEFGIEVLSHVVAVGDAVLQRPATRASVWPVENIFLSWTMIQSYTRELLTASFDTWRTSLKWGCAGLN